MIALSDRCGHVLDEICVCVVELMLHTDLRRVLLCPVPFSLWHVPAYQLHPSLHNSQDAAQAIDSHISSVLQCAAVPDILCSMQQNRRALFARVYHHDSCLDDV